MQEYPPGLLERRAYSWPDRTVVIHETWNVDTPGCPMIRNPWLGTTPYDHGGPLWVRCLTMTQMEFSNSNIPLLP